MSIHFIADLHLSPTSAKLNSKFFNYLNTLAQNAKTLYILGDFFSHYIGDDDPDPFYQEIATALKTYVEQGHEVFILHGNRDFLLGEDFAKRAKVKLLPDPTRIHLNGVPTLLTHGDQLFPDKNYLRYRKLTRNPFIQTLFLKSPLSFRAKIANKLRQSSKGNTTPIKEVDFALLFALMREYQVSQLIHGHFHNPVIHHFFLENPSVRVMLSDWGAKGNVLIANPQESLKLIYF